VAIKIVVFNTFYFSDGALCKNVNKIKYRKYECLKKAQNDKLKNVAGSV
jgi:hypothetical protein